MYPKLQSRGIAGGDNTGSCAAYVYYLGHETNWKKENGKRKEIIPYYDKNGNIVSPATIILQIDSNKKGLHLDDAKYYSLILNPSAQEIEKMGKTREDRLAAMQMMVEKMMDRYAIGFSKEGIKGHNDLMYFYTIHEYREDETGVLVPGLHAHIIISRKNYTGKYKLSPMTNHRGKSTGVIKSGFNRDAFYRDCEIIFDTTFNYHRKISESYDYLNTLKHGINEDKTAIIWASTQEEGIRETISESLARRADRLAQEAEKEEARRKIEAEQQRIAEDKKKRNQFWNQYYSQYKPQLDSLCKSCNDAFSLYRDTKEKYKVVSEELDKKYQELKKKYIELGQQRKDMTQKETAEDLIAAFVFCAVSGNMIALLVIVFLAALSRSIKEVNQASARQEIWQQISTIKKGIEILSEKKERLYLQKSTNLKAANQRMEEKRAFKEELNTLREELKQPKTKELMTEPEAPKKNNPVVGNQLAHKTKWKGVKM